MEYRGRPLATGGPSDEVNVTLVDGKDPAAPSTRVRERWYGLDWIRFLCIFYVVFGHSYKISQYEEGGWRDRDEKHEPGLYIFHAVSLGYHWCVPMLFFISGISMSIGVSSYLRKQREKERAMSFFRSTLPTACEKVLKHLRLVALSCWKLSHLLIAGVIFNIIRCEVAPLEWGGEHAPVHDPSVETAWEYRLRFWGWLMDLDPEKGGFVRAGLFGIIGSQWYTVILIGFIGITLPLVMWLKDAPEKTEKSKVFIALGTLAVVSSLALVCLTPMDVRDIAYFVAGLFIPLFALSALMYWPQRFDLRYGFLAFALLTMVLSIRKPDPKELFYLQFYIFFVVGFYTGEFKDKLFDEHNTFFLFKDFNKLFPWLLFVFWNVLPILLESMLSSIRGPYPIHKNLDRRLGSMAGTWLVVVCMLGAAFRYMNAPMVPFFYDHLYRLGLFLFVSHTLLLTLCWKYLWMPMGLTLMARFFLGCHVAVYASIAIVKFTARIENALKRRSAPVSSFGSSKIKGTQEASSVLRTEVGLR